jgi:hypothetical protein
LEAMLTSRVKSNEKVTEAGLFCQMIMSLKGIHSVKR